MSNVLIGIIGVILFIGLALAGALILGNDFTTASNSSQAAALMSQLAQAGQAAEMYKLKTGRRYIRGDPTDVVVPRFLKTPAVNPTHNARANPANWRYRVLYNDNVYADTGPSEFIAKYVVAGIGPTSDTKAQAICLEIANTYGVATVVDYPNMVDPPQAAGCVSVEGYYVAYQRIDSTSIAAGTPMP